MNPSFIILAKEDKVRHVLRCAHGLIHLTWGSATLHLHDGTLNDLADFLHCARRQLRPCQWFKQPSPVHNPE